MRIILITGISGSGKSVGLNASKTPAIFASTTCRPSCCADWSQRGWKKAQTTLAVAMDARSARSLAGLPADIVTLKEEGHDVKVLFLTAKTESLVARFSETRRSHPLSHRVRPVKTRRRPHTDRMHPARARNAVGRSRASAM